MTDLHAAFAAVQGSAAPARFLDLVADPDWEHRDTFLAYAADESISHRAFHRIAREYGAVAVQTLTEWRKVHGFPA